MDLAEYQQINDSFERTLVFHLGGEAGFFSEFNNMVLAMLYCLKHKIRFVLYSDDANFKVRRGWEDFFISFCAEVRQSEHRALNPRQPPDRMPIARQLRIYRFKRTNRIDFLTHELWNRFRDPGLARRRFSFGGRGRVDLRSAARILIAMIWRYNAHTSSRVEAIKRAVPMSGEYLGLHIRRGDKAREAPLVEASRYLDKAKSLSSVHQMFLATDDYGVVEEAARDHRDYSFSTLCLPSERGYVHQAFLRQDRTVREAQLMRLFASIDILAGAECVVGTFSSNVGMYLGMRMSRDRVFGVDQEKWGIC
jgi:hypothetical protein